jgi:hypothetical protein
MEITCPEMDLAVKLSESAANMVSELSYGWSAVNKVICMTNGLTPELKEQIQSEITTLEYWCADVDPHYTPREGFICREHLVTISFPKKHYRDKWGNTLL